MIYDKNGKKYITKKNKNGIYYSLSNAKRGLKNGLSHINKRNKMTNRVNGRYMLEHYEDYVIKEFGLIEKGIHKV